MFCGCCLKISEGMAFLEKQGIAHGTLAARNILLGQQEKGMHCIKISDTGLTEVIWKEYKQERSKELIYVSTPYFHAEIL